MTIFEMPSFLHASMTFTVPWKLTLSYAASAWYGPTRAAMCHTQSAPSHARTTSEGLVRSPCIQTMRPSSPASAGFGAMSNATTRSAPRSTSISTSLRPTKPIPPVTTHRLGTAGNRSDAPMMGTGPSRRVGSRGSATATHRPSRSPRPSKGHAPQRHAGRAGRRCLWTMHCELDLFASFENVTLANLSVRKTNSEKRCAANSRPDQPDAPKWKS